MQETIAEATGSFHFLAQHRQELEWQSRCSRAVLIGMRSLETGFVRTMLKTMKFTTYYVSEGPCHEDMMTS